MNVSELEALGHLHFGVKWKSDMARAIGVSPSYVSRALNDPVIMARISDRVAKLHERRLAEISAFALSKTGEKEDE